MADPLTIAAIGSSLLGGAASIFGGQKAADAARDASQRAEGVQRDLAGVNLQLQQPGFEVGQSALSLLANLFGLPEPTQVDFGAIQRGLNPNASNLKPVPGDERRYVDPATGQVFLVARKGGNAGQFVPLGERRPDLVEAQPQQAAGGAVSTGGIQDLLNNNPGIQFVQREGENAIARGAAARGLNQSGSTLRDLATFNQGQAATNFQNLVLNPLFQLAGFGPQAAANSGNIIGSTSNNLANIAMNAGNARASAYQNTGNVIGNTLNDLAGLALLRSGQKAGGPAFDPNGLVPFTLG